MKSSFLRECYLQLGYDNLNVAPKIKFLKTMTCTKNKSEAFITEGRIKDLASLGSLKPKRVFRAAGTHV